MATPAIAEEFPAWMLKVMGLVMPFFGLQAAGGFESRAAAQLGVLGVEIEGVRWFGLAILAPKQIGLVIDYVCFVLGLDWWPV